MTQAVSGPRAHAVRRVHHAVVNAMAAAAGAGVVCMSLWITYDVVMRYVLGAPTIWADDLAEYALLWVTFLAAPWVLRREGHVRVDIVTGYLPAGFRRKLAVVASVLCAVVCAVFAWQTGLTTLDFLQRGMKVARTWEIPLWIPYAVMPVGSALLGVEFILRALRLRGEASGEHAQHGI